MNIIKLNFLSSIKLTAIIIKILLGIFIILCISGCYTILDPPPDYIYLEEIHSTRDAVDSVIVAEKYINNYYCSSCVGYENACSRIHWRYNSWTGTYYCDPYYYNYSYYNHHYNNHYWWHSKHNMNFNEYSHNYSYVPSKKTKRDRSFSRIPDYSVVENISQDDTATSAVQSNNNISHTENIQTDNSYREITGNSATSTDSQTIKTNTKPRRKHNRKPL